MKYTILHLTMVLSIASLVSLYTGSFWSTVEKHLNTIKGLKTLSEYKEFILSRINERLTNDFFDITLVGSEGFGCFWPGKQCMECLRRFSEHHERKDSLL